MKAEELMRYDWVCLEDDNTPRQIDVIRNGEVRLFWGRIVTPPYLKPIHLTPEILEKNGFIRDGESWWYQDFRIALSTSKGISLVCGRPKNFAFVHELQHALRLCGIEKEIVL